MKIKNLYIGNILMVESEEFIDAECYWDTITRFHASFQRKTILYRKDNDSKFVVDLISKDKYPIGIPEYPRVGDIFADKLVSLLSDPKIALMADKRVNRKKMIKAFTEGQNK